MWPQSTSFAHLGYWNVGIPPSGPMDALSFANTSEAFSLATRVVAFDIKVHRPQGAAAPKIEAMARI